MTRILYIDDTPSNLTTLKAVFQEQDNAEYTVLFADNGNQGLEMLMLHSIDIIILDVMMPGLDGFETASLIKADKKMKEIPIIFLTAKQDDETIKKAFQYGVDYVSKPFNETELLSIIKFHIKLDEQIKFNQAILDSQKNLIFIKDKKNILSANKSFLNFFNINSIEEFTYNSITELFIEYDNDFDKDILFNKNYWCDNLHNHRLKKEHTVSLINQETGNIDIFRIEVDNIEDTNKYVITLTDITNIILKSKNFEEKANYDSLTKIYNRNKFNDLLEENFKLFKRYKRDICLAIFDIDFFKLVNDDYNHLVGDEVLKEFATLIKTSIRDTDLFARWGGEEFTLIMPETNINDAYKVLDNLREKISQEVFNTVGHKTCSIGLTQFNKNDTIKSLMARADKGLYTAKQTGRNKVCLEKYIN